MGCLHHRKLIRRFVHCTSDGKIGQEGVLVRGSCGLLRGDVCKGVVCGVLKGRTCVRCLGRDSRAIGGTIRLLRDKRTFPGTPIDMRPRGRRGGSKGGGAATRISDAKRRRVLQLCTWVIIKGNVSGS